MATYYYRFDNPAAPLTSNTVVRYGSSPTSMTTRAGSALSFTTTYSPLYWCQTANTGYCFNDGTTTIEATSVTGGRISGLAGAIHNKVAYPIIATFEDKNGNLSHCWQINYIDKNGVTTQVSSVRSGVEKLSKPLLTGGLLDSCTFDLRITNNNSVAVTANLSGEWQSSSNSYEIDRTIDIPANSYMSVQFTDDCEFEWLDCYAYFLATGYEDSDESSYSY